jgi:SAM-dependent methyltransferase
VASFSVNENAAVYYGNTYWNDLPQVRDEINRRVSGDPDRHWFHVFADQVGGRVFERALILNCGNGNVERGLFEIGLMKECVGIDYSHELLDQARRDNADLPATYHQMDVNTAAFPSQRFDLVVNFAAAHHIARIDKVFRALAALLPEDGWLVSYDYVGPHRNQFGYEAWEAVHRLNRSLPPEVRQDLHYPHLPTMLATDPTEAIHSELILATFERYFREVDRRLVGGALAYPLLTHNEALFAAAPSLRDPWVDHVLAADAAHLAAHPEDCLFAYFAGQPDKAVLQRTEDLDRWAAEEDRREAAAAAQGGEYGDRTLLQELYLRLEGQPGGPAPEATAAPPISGPEAFARRVVRRARASLSRFRHRT